MPDETDPGGLRARVRALCRQFPDEYWRETDRNRRYPQVFVDTLTAPACSRRSSPPGTAGWAWG